MKAEIVEPIRDKYEPRIMAIMRKIRDLIREAGWETDDEPWEMSDDEYSWWLTVYRTENGKPTEHPIMDVRFEIVEKDVRGDAESDEDYGLAFSIDVTAYGGRILGGFSPYNYTDRLWVWGEDEVEERFRLMEQCEFDRIAESCERADEIFDEEQEARR